jgi:hypothetical protein
LLKLELQLLLDATKKLTQTAQTVGELLRALGRLQRGAYGRVAERGLRAGQ